MMWFRETFYYLRWWLANIIVGVNLWDEIDAAYDAGRHYARTPLGFRGTYDVPTLQQEEEEYKKLQDYWKDPKGYGLR